MSENAETPRLVSGAFQEVSAAGGSTATSLPQEEPHIDPVDFAGLWAEARSLYFAKGFPPYASPAWQALHPDDPQRLAAALDAAEKWRKYGDEEALLQWFCDASRAFTSEGRSRVELARLRKPQPPHVLKATPGWPPIRVPGGNGRYLVPIPERRAA